MCGPCHEGQLDKAAAQTYHVWETAADICDPVLAVLMHAPPIFQQLLPTLQPLHVLLLTSMLLDMNANIVGPATPF